MDSIQKSVNTPNINLIPEVFYDGGCPLCKREIAHYIRLDKQHKILWTDITQQSERLDTVGISFKDAMEQIHCLDQNGHVQKGVNTFLIIWERLPYYRFLAVIIKILRLSTPLSYCYQKFAICRYRKRCKGH